MKPFKAAIRITNAGFVGAAKTKCSIGIYLIFGRHLLGVSTANAVGVAPLIWRLSHDSLEHRGEMSLGLEPDGDSDLAQRHGGLAQQFFGTLNSPPQKIFMGSKAGRQPELRSKVHSAQSCHGRQIQKRDLAREMIVDKFDDPPKAPFLQRAHFPSSAGFVRPAGPLIGSRRLGLQPKQPGDDGKAQRIGTNPRKVIVSPFGGCQRIGQALDDVILGFTGRPNVPHIFDAVGTISTPLARNGHALAVQYRVDTGGTASISPCNCEHKVEVLKSEHRPAFDNGMAGRRRSRFIEATQIGGNGIGVGCGSAECRPPIGYCTIDRIIVVAS